MNKLLARIVEAHGGLDRWRRFNRVEATIVTGGAFWGMKNLTQDQDPRRMTVSLHEERSSVAPFGDPDWHTEFTPDRIAILRGDGTVVAERHDPRKSFAGHEMTTPWDPLHRAYFNGYALWTYLTHALPAHDGRGRGNGRGAMDGRARDVAGAPCTIPRVDRDPQRASGLLLRR